MYPHCLAVMVPMLLSEPRAGFGSVSGQLRGPAARVPMLLTPRMAYQREFFGEGLFMCGPAGALFRAEVFRGSAVSSIDGAPSDSLFWMRAYARRERVCCCRRTCSGTACIHRRSSRARKAQREYAG